ncbi:MAG: FAD-dependent oxidoreductase [Bacteroidetes bacterium]|nr:FAD-dependent oxidoreductase [Bacteroidota bacterium]
MQRHVKNVDPTLIDELAIWVRGKIIRRDDESYEKVCQVYNGMIRKHPGMFVQCVDVADVIHAVQFARKNNLLVSIKCGGHNAAGLGLCDDGLVIDLSGIKFVQVDVDDNTVRVGGGNLLGEMDYATHAYGLAVPAGIISSTGVGGLTLGGGVGYLTRKHGLTIDNLLEVDMVLADGSFVTANKKQHEDLFWAIRGGGGNFGVVTAFKFQGHPVKTVFGGPTFWPIEQTEEIMEWYNQFIEQAPDELNGFIATLVVPGPPFPTHLHGKKCCGVVWCYAGDMQKTEKLFKPIRALKPIFEHLGEMPYPAIQQLFDGMLPPGMHWYWRADFYNDLDAGARSQHVKFGSTIPTDLSQMHLYPINGAAGRVAIDATPWAYRDAKYAGVILGVDPDPAKTDLFTKWCKDYWEALHPFSAGGAYSNFMMDESESRVKAAYGSNYAKLVAIKNKYDPDNFFRVNQNIKPSV